MCVWVNAGDHGSVLCILHDRHVPGSWAVLILQSLEMWSEDDRRARSCSHVLCDGVLPFYETVTPPFAK